MILLLIKKILYLINKNREHEISKYIILKSLEYRKLFQVKFDIVIIWIAVYNFVRKCYEMKRL